MEAQTLNCPNCGAAATTDATHCAHCNSRLATVACPACFGMMFVGAKFCSHCGAKAARQALASDAVRLCPRCKVNTEWIVVGKTDLRECPRCEGIWADAAGLQDICTDREQQAAVLGLATVMEPVADRPLEKVSYVPCPECQELMHRVNFARCSNVVVDVCKVHGTWFDKDELRRIVEFIRAGGLDRAREKEIEELERKKRQLQDARNETFNSQFKYYPQRDPWNSALAAAAISIVSSIFD